jgi:DNA-3-methyladenine glycosylase II
VEADHAWAAAVLGVDATWPSFDDPVIVDLATCFEGLRPLSDGSLFEGVVTSIVGQSISVAAAAVTQRKLCESFGDPLLLADRAFWPLPSASMLADADIAVIRASGVTWKRAEAIHHVARLQASGNFPTTAEAVDDPSEVVRHLVTLPGIGRWTAESAVLWGTGAIDAHPTNDVALLRAARRRYERPEMTLRELDALSDAWRPARSIAARLLWTDLLGVAP